MSSSIGIYGIGAHLPPHIRHNDYWPESVTRGWWRTVGGKLDRPKDQEITDPAHAIVKEAMARYRDDPFKGSRQRHIMGPDDRTTDMEIAAAREALDRAEIAPSDIDLLLGQTTLPDQLLVPNVCRVHETLGLPPSCLSLQTEGICAAFLLQLELARSLIGSGRCRYALLVQSSGTSRFLEDPEEPIAPWVGDGATAVVVGPVQEGFGILSSACRTDGSFFDASPTPGQPDVHWSKSETLQIFVPDTVRARALLLDTVRMSHGVIQEAFRKAELAPTDIDFFGCHQGFAWLREAVQRFAGMTNARAVDTFPWAGSLLGCNIPLVLRTAGDEGLLKDGDRTALFAGASGVILDAVVMRWGGRMT